MTQALSVRQRINSYGVLSTVLALVIAVVYSNNRYDDWDALIALLGAIFGANFLLRIKDADVMEIALSAFLTGLSAAIFVAAFLSFAFSEDSDLAEWLDQNLLVVSFMASIAACVFRVLYRWSIK